MVMQEISISKAKAICAEKGLEPGLVKGTEDGIQFTKGRNDRIEMISWDEFENILRRKNLAIYESNGWMKIMKKK